MNKDQIKGAVKDAAGKVQSKAGEMTGSTEQQAKGMVKQAEGLSRCCSHINHSLTLSRKT